MNLVLQIEMNIHLFPVFLAFLFSFHKIPKGNTLPASINTTKVTNNKNITALLQDISVNQCNVSYIKIGCYEDANIENSSFPSLILKPVLHLLNSSSTWSLRGELWSKFLPNFVCHCAQRAKQLNYNYFGVKRFDQCWSGDTTLYYRNPTSNGCIELEMNSCNSSIVSPCAGNSTSVFVYRLSTAE